MTPGEWENARLVYGHGVSDRLLPMLPHEGIDLVFVAREPISLFGSRAKHLALMRARRGDSLDIDKYCTKYDYNPMARKLIEAYGGFVEGVPAEDEATLRQIVQCIRFLLCTERLNDQMSVLSEHVGIPA